MSIERKIFVLLGGVIRVRALTESVISNRLITALASVDFIKFDLNLQKMSIYLEKVTNKTVY